MKIRGTYLIGIIIVIAVLVVAIYLIFSQTQRHAPGALTSSDIAVFIGESEIFTDKENLIIANTLQPKITIRYPKKLDVAEVLLDNRINLLSETPLLEGIEVAKDSGEISIKVPFLISPASHNISIKTGNQDNQTWHYSFPFSLGIKNEFNESINDSSFFIIPENTRKYSPESWVIEKGKLKASSPNTSYASLAFIYPFKDVFASFQLTPNEGPINLVFYFLESGRSIVIGNGNNKDITLLRGGSYSGVAVNGKPFVMEARKTYSVFISREQNVYKVYISQGDNRKKPLESDLLLEFTDDLLINDKEESLGFAVWKGSGGLEIDNLIISTFSHY